MLRMTEKPAGPLQKIDDIYGMKYLQYEIFRRMLVEVGLDEHDQSSHLNDRTAIEWFLW